MRGFHPLLANSQITEVGKIIMHFLPENTIRPNKKLIPASSAIVFVLFLTMQSFGVDCIVAPTLDRAFPEKWMHCPAGSAPFLSQRDTVYAGAPWGILVLFQGYGRDDSGKVDLSFSYKIRKPNGKIFHDTAGIKAVGGFIEKDTGVLLSTSIPMFSFSRKDAPGKYKITVKAEDRITKTKKTKDATIILSKYPDIASNHFNDISLNIWVHSYCIDPDPGRALAAFSYFIESPLSNDNDVFWAVFYFFQCVFKENPFLADELVAKFPVSSQRLREYIVFLLRSIQYDKAGSKTPIPDSLWKKFDKVAATGFYDPFTFAFKIKSNRFLEFGFYYYGRYSIVRFFIDCLGLPIPAGYDAFIKKCTTYTNECPDSLDKETALEFFSNARKILGKTYAKHALVNAYCTYAYEQGDLDTNARKKLKEIVDSAKK